MDVTKKIYDLGDRPPLGDVPEMMWASCIRKERYGEPQHAMKVEQVPTPRDIGDHDVLVYIMVAGVNHNGVWASRADPIDVIDYSNRLMKSNYDYFILGSEASGIVWAVGDAVTHVGMGDHVIISPLVWDPCDPYILAGGDPDGSCTLNIWGYEKNGGAFGQFSKVKDFQCVKKPETMTWADAGGGLGNVAIAIKTLCCIPGKALQKDDAVLVWGGAGKIGEGTIVVANYLGAKPIAVVSNDEKADFVINQLGAHGVLNRNNYKHWGPMPNCADAEAYSFWLTEAKRFTRDYYEALGEHKRPSIVVDHPGEDTLPTSIFIADNKGMVSICGGTSGYTGTLDLRFLWMRSKRLQGVHGYTAVEHLKALEILKDLDGPLGINVGYPLDRAGDAHQVFIDNKKPTSNIALLVNAESVDEC